MAFEVKVDPPVIRVDANGAVRVGPTRMLFALVISAFKDGKTPEQINEMYTAVSLANLYKAIGYYLEHREDCDAFMREWDEEWARTEERCAKDNADIRLKIQERKRERTDAIARRLAKA